MAFFDPFMVGVMQVQPVEIVTIITPITPPTPPQPQVPQGFFKKRQKYRFEYYFAQVYNQQRGEFIGAKVLEEGSFLSQNCLFFYLDPTLKIEVSLRFNNMLKFLSWRINEENITLAEAIENLEQGESFKFIIYGEYRRPDNLGDTIDVLTIEVPDALKGFLTCEINKAKPQKPLRDGDSFKLLFTITKNDAWETFPKDKIDASFGLTGHAYRIVD